MIITGSGSSSIFVLGKICWFFVRNSIYSLKFSIDLKKIYILLSILFFKNPLSVPFYVCTQ